MSAMATVDEVRILEGPNLYFPRPAAKITVSMPGYLALDETQLLGIARQIGVRRVDPGAPNTEARQRYLLGFAERVVRLLARESGTARLGVRARPTSVLEQIIVAFPVRARRRAEQLGAMLEPVLESLVDDGPSGTTWSRAVEAIRAEGAADVIRTVRAKVPVVAITGTNGKTTTTRLVAHIAMTAGLRTGWSSTDGVLVQGELVESGDYSGPAGARTVLAAKGIQFAVLETARGGMLLKGLGTATNDVSVVTNVSADHLGMQGIDTLDQLAEVKGIITRVTKPNGWVVLNGDDPRVWAMRTGASGRPWCFTLSPDAPALREALDAGGRGITIMDSDVVVLQAGSSPERLLSVLDIPMTLAGLSQHNMANALAATAAALGAGLPQDKVIAGLRSFAPDASHNPGRMNIYLVPLPAGGSASVILDMAHNEAGLEALLDVARGLRRPGSQLRLGLGTGGDRTDEILCNLGELAGLHADQVHVVHKAHYLRGRTMADLEDKFRVGLQRAGATAASSSETELAGLQMLLAAAHDGDVLPLMTHSDRAELHDYLLAHGAQVASPAQIRKLVIAARGEHEAEPDIEALWADDDAERRIRTASALVAQYPGDGRVLYEYAGTFDSAGREQEAVEAYDVALAAGLPEPFARRAVMQKASTLRHLGRLDESAELLKALHDQWPDNTAVAAFYALTLHDQGRDDAALGAVLRQLVAESAHPDVARYHRSLTRFASEIN